MNSVDIILGVILLIAFYSGFKKGLFVALASLIGLILGVIGAVYFSGYAGSYLASKFDWGDQTTSLAAFALTFLVIIFVVSLLGKFLTKVADFAALGIVNKLLGGVFAALKYAFIVSVLFMFMSAYSGISGYVISEEKKENSMLYAPVSAFAPLILPRILEKVDSLKDEVINLESYPDPQEPNKTSTDTIN